MTVIVEISAGLNEPRKTLSFKGRFSVYVRRTKTLEGKEIFLHFLQVRGIGSHSALELLRYLENDRLIAVKQSDEESSDNKLIYSRNLHNSPILSGIILEDSMPSQKPIKRW